MTRWVQLLVNVADDAADGQELLDAGVSLDAAEVDAEVALPILLGAIEAVLVKQIDDQLAEADPSFNATLRHEKAQMAARLQLVDWLVHLPMYPPAQGAFIAVSP